MAFIWLYFQELILCRNAVLLLAFLASSGKSGFEIIATHKLLQDANFLMLILQVLAAEVDQTAVKTEQQQLLYKERYLITGRVCLGICVLILLLRCRNHIFIVVHYFVKFYMCLIKTCLTEVFDFMIPLMPLVLICSSQIKFNMFLVVC